MATKAASAKSPEEFEKIFRQLKQLVKPYEKRLNVATDEPGNYMTETKSPSFKGKPMMFAAVMSKSYVAFHFFPVYMFPDLVKDISPELKKRMQGKTCWNFKKVEDNLFEELAGVVKEGFDRYSSAGYL